MSEKMDRAGVRMPADVERKYAGQFGVIQDSVDEVKQVVQQVSDTLKDFMAEWNEKFEGLTGGYKVTFLVGDTVFRSFTVTDGRSITAPMPEPTSESGVFFCWQDASGNAVTFPYTPNGNVEFSAVFVETYADKLRNHFGVSKTECPYVVLEYFLSAYVRVYFCSGLTNETIYPKYYVDADTSVSFADTFTNHTDYNTIVSAVTTRYSRDKCKPYTSNTTPSVSAYYWSNKPDWVPINKLGYYSFE